MSAIAIATNEEPTKIIEADTTTKDKVDAETAAETKEEKEPAPADEPAPAEVPADTVTTTAEPDAKDANAKDATVDATIENDKPAEAETDADATKVRLRGRRRESRRDF